MRGSQSRTVRLLCVLAFALAIGGCHTTKVVNFPAPAEPCPSQEDLDLLADLLGATHPTAERFVYSWSYCTEGEERLQ